MQKITPFLWFDDNAEEAVSFYTSVFKNSKRGKITRFPEGAPRPKGMVMTASFEIDGQELVAINGGPQYKFTPAVSFHIHCKDQAEVDYLWEKLSAGGQTMPCGWVTDKFGLSWQVVPDELSRMLDDKDPVRAQRAMQAMLEMRKLDIATLKKAYEG